MGLCAAKLNPPPEPPVNKDARGMYFDENGVLRHKEAVATTQDRETELRRVLAADNSRDAPGTTWFVVHNAWMRAWLRYTRTDYAPRPDKVNNTDLVVVRPGDVHIRHDLEPAGYRRVCEPVWDIFMELYGGGPAITVTSAEGESLDDTERWEIDMEVPDAVDSADESEPDSGSDVDAAALPDERPGASLLSAAEQMDMPDMTPMPAAARPDNDFDDGLGADGLAEPVEREPAEPEPAAPAILGGSGGGGGKWPGGKKSATAWLLGDDSPAPAPAAPAPAAADVGDTPAAAAAAAGGAAKPRKSLSSWLLGDDDGASDPAPSAGGGVEVDMEEPVAHEAEMAPAMASI